MRISLPVELGAQLQNGTDDRVPDERRSQQTDEESRVLPSRHGLPMDARVLHPPEMDRIRKTSEHLLLGVLGPRLIQRESAPGEKPRVTGVAQRVEHAPDDGTDGALVRRHGQGGQHVGAQAILGILGESLGQSVAASEVVEDRGV